MSGFGKKRIAGVDYDLDHLDPFTMEVKAKEDGAPPYTVRVSFGFHCFTREITPEDSPDLHMVDGREKRCFCHERYKLSKELVDMIRYAAAGRAYFGDKGNFLIVEMPGEGNAPYVAFFDVEKAKKSDGFDGAMFVTSAHLRPKLPEKLPAVSFVTVVDYRINGRKLTRPPPRNVIAQKRK
ncbi:hypothetical protein ABIB99_005877 [Bradyrhizobium sp. LA6.1]|uniref:hypothetical protein n=1 Tax=Bradyrhizobium sp. LA6.1 TaxID=3156378 RepID=UPI003397043B